MRRLLLLTLPLCASPLVLAATGGPDAGGMVFTDSLEADGPSHAWLDASGGDAHALGDDALSTVALPFSFEFYGVAYDEVQVSSNGVVFFSGATTSATGTCPAGPASWAGIAAYWDDLAASTVYTDTFGYWPQRTFVISWDGVAHATAGGAARVQVWLLEGRNEAVIALDDTTFGDPAYDGGATAVIGVTDTSGGVPYACTGGVADGTSVWYGTEDARPARSVVRTDELDAPWTGTADFDYAGRALAASDANGDGASDLLVGNRDGGAGTAYLIYRPDVAGTFADADATFTGQTSGDDFGAALAMGDVDGDGYEEIVVGAPDAGVFVGNTYVFSDTSWGGAFTYADADDTWTGPSSGGLGGALAVGDFDGDGNADLVLGAPTADVSTTNAGAVYIVYGGPVAGGTHPSTGADVTVQGTAAGDQLGTDLAMGDLDGDGAADLLATALYEDGGGIDSGSVYVLPGQRTAGSWTLASMSECELTSDAGGARFGDALAVGDVDGTGLLDFVIGASTYDGTYADGGAASLVLDYVTAGCPASPAAVDAIVYGTAASANLGGSAAIADLDGDGVDDLALGAPNMTEAATGAGVAYVFTTAPSGTLSASDAHHELRGTSAGGAFATALAPATNADGTVTLAATAPYDSVAYTDEGALWQWTYRADFTDEDADGFVDADAGGNDCDDTDATAYPGGTDTSGDSVDGDCDGWIDGVIRVREDVTGWTYDLDDLGVTTTTTYDFEVYADGTLLSTYGDLTLGGAIYADDRVYGAFPEGDVGARLVGGSTNELSLTFAQNVDALAIRVLDPEGTFTLTAIGPSSLAVPGYTFSLDADDRAGGEYLGFVFAEEVTQITLTAASTTDGFGIDDVVLVLASDTDRDLDGYTDAEGDCDDTEFAVNPGVAETLANGVDDDCDGVIDAGDATTYTDSGLWSADAGITSQVIDFEDVGAGEVVTTQYRDLGADFDGALAGDTDVDGTAPNDLVAASNSADVTEILFEEDQPAIALTLLDGDGAFTIDATVGGVAAYSVTVTPTSERQFVGLVFDLPVDAVTITGPAGDAWAVDDLTCSALGLDDADGDGLTEAEGDCDDADATVSPEATETWYDGTDSDCAGDDDYDADGDGVQLADDCDDGDATVSPDATETWYDGVDADCDGLSDYDADGDGHASDAWGGDDCDDDDATVSPDATDAWYDGVDSDCAGNDDFDADGDGFPTDAGGGGTDCDDGDAAVSPDATETWYDGVDSDCSGETTSDYDQDGDGFDAVAWGGEDCDDELPLVYPGASGETCWDGVDQDCDGGDDYDCDGDGYAWDLYGGEDCDDTDDAVNPDASDVLGDGLDTNCDGMAEYDDDLDGYDGVESGGDDCDDTDATINPGAADTCYDGLDQDCDGASDFDCDADGEDGDAWGGADCADDDATIWSSATDFPYDGIDQDCDGASEYDQDGDGHDADWYGGDDCDDADATVYPGATDALYDGVDADCAGDSDDDADGDGYGIDTDCDETDASISPGATEVPDDGVDQDCDGADVETCDDCDGDGYDATSDCDDTDATVNPGATDAWYDGIDSDCDLADDYDQDGDGARAEAWGGGDCDDTTAAKAPSNSTDDCGGGDEDCDGRDDEDCVRVDTGPTDDTGVPIDTGPFPEDTGPDTRDTDVDWRPDTPGAEDPDYAVSAGEGCGCATGGGGTGAGVALGVAALALLRRRRG
ncbi:MAG: MopE-related protein [Myxococcota bacterium]